MTEDRIEPTDLGIGTLFWRVPEAVIVGDASTGTIVLWNPGAERIFGYTAAEAVGNKIEMLVAPGLVEAHRAGIARFAATRHGKIIDSGTPVELLALRKDGSLITVELSLSTIDGPPALPQPILALVRDVSERKRAEELRLELAREQAARAASEQRAQDAREQAAAHVQLNAALRELAEERDRALSSVEAERRALAARAREAELAREVGAALKDGAPLREQLQRCAAAMVTQLGAAFARIWLLDEAEQVLELQASAGAYTHIDGPHGRVPVGTLKIGLIAQERLPHLTNRVVGDPRVSDQEWAEREGMVAFAGYPLIVGERLVGVMAMFAKQELDEQTLRALATVADMLAMGIERAQVTQKRG